MARESNLRPLRTATPTPTKKTPGGSRYTAITPQKIKDIQSASIGGSPGHYPTPTYTPPTTPPVWQQKLYNNPPASSGGGNLGLNSLTPATVASLGNAGGAGNLSAVASAGGVAASGAPGLTSGGFGDPATTDPMTGFAARYAPGMVDSVYQNPEILSGDVLKSMGYNNPTLANLTGPLADTGVALNFILNGGGAGRQNDWSDADAINYAAGFLQNQMTPGGRVIDTDAALRAILGANGASPVGSFLGLTDPAQGATNVSSLTPEQQINQYNQLLSAAWTGMNPYFQRAMSNLMGSSETGYNSQLAHGVKNVNDYGQYLRGTPLADWAGM